MNESPDPLLLDHEFDGIRELDNNLPRWWVLLFYGSITFAVVYMLHFHVFKLGNLMAAEYERELKAGEALKGNAMEHFEKRMAQLEPLTDPKPLADGKQLYEQMCAPCHRVDGGGLVGPNLTDDYWIHGSSFADNIRIIWNGVPEKGMVTWKTLLKPDQILAIGSYIYTLRGSSPADPKPPESQAPVEAGANPYE